MSASGNGMAANKRKPRDEARGLPHNREAEEGALACLMLEPWRFDEIYIRLEVDEFYDANCRTLYTVMRNIHNAGGKIDEKRCYTQAQRFITTAEEQTEFLAWLIEIAGGAPSSANLIYFADMVKDQATRRRLILAGNDLLTAAHDHASDIKKTVREFEGKVGDIGAARNRDQLHFAGDVAAEFKHRFKAKKGPVEGVETGIHVLDVILGPMLPGHFIVLAARPGVGKTALATSIIAHHLGTTEKVGYACTLEMDRTEFTERLLVNMADVDMFRFQNHYLGDAELERVYKTVEGIQEAKRLWIDDAPYRTATEVISMARRTKRLAGRLDYMVIDYIGLMDSELHNKAMRHEVISDISRKLKVAAGALEIPIICLAQLNRDADAGRPRISHLRDSGALEQDADKVVFIDRKIDDEKEGATAELIVAKNRKAKCGSCRAHFMGGKQRFASFHDDVAF